MKKREERERQMRIMVENEKELESEWRPKPIHACPLL